MNLSNVQDFWEPPHSSRSHTRPAVIAEDTGMLSGCER